MGLDNEIDVVTCNWDHVQACEAAIPAERLRYSLSVASEQSGVDRHGWFRAGQPLKESPGPQYLLQLELDPEAGGVELLSTIAIKDPGKARLTADCARNFCQRPASDPRNVDAIGSDPSYYAGERLPIITTLVHDGCIQNTQKFDYPPGFEQPRCNFESHRSTERMAEKANIADRLAPLDLLDGGVCHAGNRIRFRRGCF